LRDRWVQKFAVFRRFGVDSRLSCSHKTPVRRPLPVNGGAFLLV
jgi:hypothetical protein